LTNFFLTITGDLCINRNNHQKPTFHPLGDFLNPVLALLGQGLKNRQLEAFKETDMMATARSLVSLFSEFVMFFIFKE
jgi:hypothetical protein